MRVAIIDYGSGNLRSATKAFERAAREAGIAAEIDLTDSPDKVATADRLVLPGVGAYADCRRGLAAVEGMEDALTEAVEKAGRPFLGICVGMFGGTPSNLAISVMRGGSVEVIAGVNLPMLIKLAGVRGESDMAF